MPRPLSPLPTLGQPPGRSPAASRAQGLTDPVLAWELASAGSKNLGVVFAGYERVMRLLVAKGQGVPKLVPRMFHPQRLTRVRALRTISRPAVRRALGRVPGSGLREAEPLSYNSGALAD